MQRIVATLCAALLAASCIENGGVDDTPPGALEATVWGPIDTSTAGGGGGGDARRSKFGPQRAGWRDVVAPVPFTSLPPRRGRLTEGVVPDVVLNGTAYFTLAQALVAFDLATGVERWRVSDVFEPGTFVAASTDWLCGLTPFENVTDAYDKGGKRLRCIAAGDGQARWETALPEPVRLLDAVTQKPILFDLFTHAGTLVVVGGPAYDARLSAFDLVTGAQLFTRPTELGGRSIAARDGVLVVPSTAGTDAIDVRTGQVLASFAASGLVLTESADAVVIRGGNPVRYTRYDFATRAFTDVTSSYAELEGALNGVRAPIYGLGPAAADGSQWLFRQASIAYWDAASKSFGPGLPAEPTSRVRLYTNGIVYVDTFDRVSFVGRSPSTPSSDGAYFYERWAFDGAWYGAD